MEYAIYKLDFSTGVHFGTGTLNQTEYTLAADQLFSALYIEAVKMGKEKQLLEASSTGKLLFSDLLPYIGNQYMIPKPMIYVEPKEQGVSSQKKMFKKIKYIPVDWLQSFLDGTMDVSNNPMEQFGVYQQQTMASVRGKEDAVPFRVGTFYFNESCGLYVLLAYESRNEKELAEILLEAVSYTGVGGKKSSGLGKYTLIPKKIPDQYLERLQQDVTNRRVMTLSVCLPMNQELDRVLERASYQLIKRSGFVASATFADEPKRKRDLFAFSSGSCFYGSFRGDIYDVAVNGIHPVYRYVKPLLISLA